MNIAKYVGALCILLASLMLFAEIQRNDKKRLEQLSAYIELIDCTKQQIECYKIPINQIFSQLDATIFQKCGYLINDTPKSFEDLLDNSDLRLDIHAISVLNAFSNKFGSVYFNEQIASCNECSNQLKDLLEKNRAKVSQDIKIRLALCLCFSVSLILMLI
jgi:hypothetical protein